MTSEIYLDNNATTQPLPQVTEAMVRVLGADFGNPSSVHTSGDRVRDRLRQARSHIACLLGVDAGQLVFTSGGTEANNMVFASVALARGRKNRIVTTSIEHSSILKMADWLISRGVEVITLPVNASGAVDPADVAAAVNGDTSLVSVQWVNNETGVIQPIRELGQICRSKGTLFHTDAAQGVGKLPIDVSELHIDFLTFTGHKFHGPQGVGVVVAQNLRSLTPILFGGSQERGLRAGTENVPGIVGLGRASELRADAFADDVEKLAILRDGFEQRVLAIVPDVEINGDFKRRVCNTTNLCFHGVDGQALVAQLDNKGIRCSQSSACTNQRPEPSYVLRAMGLSEQDAYSSVRFSFGVLNTEEEIETAVTAIRDICVQLRGFTSQLYNPYLAART